MVDIICTDGIRADKNSLLSPPLTMLPEIRAKMLRYLVGGRAVHVRFVRRGGDSGVFEDGLPEQLPVAGKLRCALCAAGEMESEAYAPSNSWLYRCAIFRFSGLSRCLLRRSPPGLSLHL